MAYVENHIAENDTTALTCYNSKLRHLHRTHIRYICSNYDSGVVNYERNMFIGRTTAEQGNANPSKKSN